MNPFDHSSTQDVAVQPAHSNAWLTGLLARTPRLLARFATFYRKLHSLPQRQRRRITQRAAVSLTGAAKVPGVTAAQGEDILGFCATSTGATTAGTWHMVLDGSAEEMPKNATDSISANEDGSVIYLTTKAAFDVDDAFGGHSMVYKFEGDEFSGPFFSAPANGLDQKVDGLHVEGDLP